MEDPRIAAVKALPMPPGATGQDFALVPGTEGQVVGASARYAYPADTNVSALTSDLAMQLQHAGWTVARSATTVTPSGPGMGAPEGELAASLGAANLTALVGHFDGRTVCCEPTRDATTPVTLYVTMMD